MSHLLACYTALRTSPSLPLLTVTSDFVKGQNSRKKISRDLIIENSWKTSIPNVRIHLIKYSEVKIHAEYVCCHSMISNIFNLLKILYNNHV